MFAAVSAHKFVIAFCIGVELMVQKTKPWLAFVYVLIYSAVSAIGK
jgi:zinc transporter 1/2/3